jgi:hypothetical protein
MMGQQAGIQPKIFYPHLNLEQRVPRTNLLRKIQEQIDFDFSSGVRSCNRTFQKTREVSSTKIKMGR